MKKCAEMWSACSSPGLSYEQRLLKALNSSELHQKSAAQLTRDEQSQRKRQFEESKCSEDICDELLSYLDYTLDRSDRTPEVCFLSPGSPMTSTITRIQSLMSEQSSQQFRVLTLNILSENYCSNQMYFYCDSMKLKWRFRVHRLLKFLRELDVPELVSLQELDRPDSVTGDSWFNSYYNSSFTQRTGQKRDGCFLAWRKDRFRKVGHGMLELNDLSKLCHSESAKRHYLRENVGSWVILEHRSMDEIESSPRYLCFATCHLYYHWSRSDIRLRQVSYLLNALHRSMQDTSEKLRLRDADEISLILSGDFNAHPHKSVYSFLRTGQSIVKAQGNSDLKLLFDPCLSKATKLMRSLGVDSVNFNGTFKKHVVSEDSGEVVEQLEYFKRGKSRRDKKKDKKRRRLERVKQRRQGSEDVNPTSVPSTDPSRSIGDGTPSETPSSSGSPCSTSKRNKEKKKPKSDKSGAAFNRRSLVRSDSAAIFERCRREDRYLVTRSSKLTTRRDCPSKHVLVPSQTAGRPRDVMKFLIRYFDLSYDPKMVYSRCSLCNGTFTVLSPEEIQECEDIPDAMKQSVDGIPVDPQSGAKKVTFYRCVGCSQVYWWGYKTQNEADRLKQVFDQIQLEDAAESQDILDETGTMNKHSLGLFAPSDLFEKENERWKADCLPNVALHFWSDVIFTHPFRLVSCAMLNDRKTEPEYTNKCAGFQGTLDYIFYHERGQIECQFGDVLLPYDGPIPFPNSRWFSDHIPIYSLFRFKS